MPSARYRPTRPSAAAPGSSCDCSALCCDGYTEFCCTLYGSNSCPPGTLAAGWWRPTSPGSASRMASTCPGTTSTATWTTAAAVGAGRPGRAGRVRRSLRLRVRRRHLRQPQGVLRSVPLWPMQPGRGLCGPDRVPGGDLHPAVGDRRIVHDDRSHRQQHPVPRPTLPARPSPSDGATRRGQRDHLAATQLAHRRRANQKFHYGVVGDHPVMGDWTASGTATVGIVGGTRLPASQTPLCYGCSAASLGDGEPDIVFEFGRIGDIPVVGDWTGDGRDLPGCRPHGTWMLRTSFESGQPDIEFDYGGGNGIPVVGDWDGSGGDSPGTLPRW